MVVMKLWQGIQFRLHLSPVVIRLPVAHQLLHRRQLDALRLITDRFPVGPLGRCQAPPEVGEGRVGHVGAEGTHTLSLGYGLGLIELAHFLFSFQPRGLFVGLRVRRATHAKLGHSDRHGGIAQKKAAIVLGCFRHLSPSIHFTVRVGWAMPEVPRIQHPGGHEDCGALHPLFRVGSWCILLSVVIACRSRSSWINRT
jgi:hypothetical protein